MSCTGVIYGVLLIYIMRGNFRKFVLWLSTGGTDKSIVVVDVSS